MNYLASTRPFAAASKREEVLRRIRQGGVTIPDYSVSGRPEFALGVLGRPEALAAFEAAIDWVLEELKVMDNEPDSETSAAETGQRTNGHRGVPPDLWLCVPLEPLQTRLSKEEKTRRTKSLSIYQQIAVRLRLRSRTYPLRPFTHG